MIATEAAGRCISMLTLEMKSHKTSRSFLQHTQSKMPFIKIVARNETDQIAIHSIHTGSMGHVGSFG